MSTTARLRRLWGHRQVLDTLVRRDLRVRYARSALGYVWTLIDPLAMAMVYAFVFGILFTGERHTPGIPYIVFLLAGMLPWNWFNNCVNETSRALYAERLLVRSTNIPRELWVIRVVLAKGIEFLLSLPILAAFCLFFLVKGQLHLDWQVLWILPAMLLQLLLCIGVGLVMAPITALVEDFVRLVRIALRIGFYFTPIVYSVALVQERAPAVVPLLNFNPLVGITDMYRVGLTDHPSLAPMWTAWVTAAAFSIGWFLFGMWVFKKLEPAVLKEI